MAWIVQPLERKDPDTGEALGLYHLTANSDEGGGFAVGCDHDHSTPAEAATCKDALVRIGQVTGLPYRDRAAEAEDLANAQIKHMVDRFLAWKLPADFSPDGGISFKAAFNEHTPHEGKHEPLGTNLLNAVQAAAMVRHLIEDMPKKI